MLSNVEKGRLPRPAAKSAERWPRNDRKLVSARAKCPKSCGVTRDDIIEVGLFGLPSYGRSTE